MMEKPIVSVIMAAYNAEATIGEAIKSVISQTYTNWELIVVDDDSIDATRDIVQQICEYESRIKYIKNSHNEGVSCSRKKALQHAEGQWIAILDSDDLWKPEKLARQMLEQKKYDFDLVFTGSAYIVHDGTPVDWVLHVPQKIQYRELLKQNLISNSSVLVRKELYERYYVVGDHLHEDFAMWLSLLKSGVKVYGIDEPLLVYRLSKQSKSGNKLRAAIMTWRTYRYIGLGVVEALYYQVRYIINGVLKYRHLK